MQALSFKNTPLFKRGIWLSAAALTACVAVLSAFFGYFLWKARLHRLADEVIDCDDHLKVRRGRTEEIIHFSNIAGVEVSTGAGIHRFTVRLREATRLGLQIEFLPQACSE